MEAARWVGYLEHRDERLLGVFTANAGKGGCTIFHRMLFERYGVRFMGLPWCVIFVFAVRPEGLGRPCAGVRELWRRLRRKGLIRDNEGMKRNEDASLMKKRPASLPYTPVPGDLIFCFVGGKIGHVGIVESCDGVSVTSIDGNTVDPTGTLPPEAGGAVARRKRRLDDPVIAGYMKNEELGMRNEE